MSTTSSTTAVTVPCGSPARAARSAGSPSPAVTSRALKAYLADGIAGPIFLNRFGTARLSYASAYEQLRRLVRAGGVPGAEAIHPHSFRHTFGTEALDAGAALQDVQDALGHADARTTRRYDRSRNRLDKDPTYALAAAMGRL